MIYLDNAATSYPKPLCVRLGVARALEGCGGNPGRSGHLMSIRSSEYVYKAREVIAGHIGFCCPERIVFTQNATHALNFAIKGLITEPCHVIISNLEHNSVLRPVISLQGKIGVTYSVYDSRKPLKEEIEAHIKEDTKFIITTAVSNVTGAEINLKEISEIAKSHNLGLIIDLSQYLGHRLLDVSDLHFSALCAPSHKGLLGIMGGGFAVFNEGVSPVPIFEGGSGYDTLNPMMPSCLPERLEAGTVPTVAIISLIHGIGYIEKYGVSCIEKRMAQLCNYASELLKELKFVKVYGAENGIVAFNVDGVGSGEVADLISTHGICVRGGLQCSPVAHKAYNTLEQGMVRASFSVFNTKRDVDRLCNALLAEYKRGRR